MAPAMESACTGAMNSVLAKLVILLGDEYKLLTKDIRKKVVFFKDELGTMRALLERLAAMEDHDPLTKGWMRQVREMTYDLDDSIDEFLHSVNSQQGVVKIGFPRMAAQRKSLIARLRLTEKIQVLNRRIREASERRSRYKIDDAATFTVQTVAMDPRPSARDPHKGNPVGIDRPLKELTWLLTDGQQELKVVAIIGMGGLGKTTLAMNVYERLRLQFDCGAVVKVSRRPDMPCILRRILYQVGARNNHSSQAFDDVRILIDALREFFCTKRYFIVIDDIWDKQVWQLISCAFLETNLGSKILVTTRNMDIAMSCCRDNGDDIYQLPPLDIINSRELLFRRIFYFEFEESCPPELKEIAYEILEKCCGLPLAIITMAGLLATRPREDAKEAWKYICQSLNNSTYYGNILTTLNLSYNDLPLHLKTCLLYLSMFQEGHIIDRKRQVRRWMAEGFVSAKYGMGFEESGEYYFNELINRGLIEAVDIQYDGRVGACQVHDIIWDLIYSKSADENFVMRYEHGDKFVLQDKVRRLYLDCQYQGDTFRPSEITASQVRSLTIIGSRGQMPALENFRRLRVLDLEHHGDLDKDYLRNIGRLKLLRYLRLDTTLIQLPEGIGKLQYLETLDVSTAVGCELPKSIVRLKTLMYLLVKNAKLPDGLGSMKRLLELSCVKIDSSNSLSSLDELGNLPLLSTLRIKWCIDNQHADMETYADILISSLRKLSTSKLQSFCIEAASGYSLAFLLDCFSIPCYCLQEFQMESDYYLPTVPKWMPSLFNLALLRINIEVVGEDVMQILGRLQALRALILMVKSIASDQGLVIRGSGFKCLKQFDFICQNSWLMFEPGAMVILEKLRVVYGAHEKCEANNAQFSIEHLIALKHVVAVIDCANAKAKDVNAAEHAIKYAVSIHRNHPRFELRRLDEQLIVEDERGIILHDKETMDQNVDDETIVEEEKS